MSFFPSSLRPWKKLSSTVVFQSPYFRVRRDRCQLPDDSVIDDYFVVERSDVVAIIAVTSDGKLLLNAQYKHGVGENVWEVPAGIIDDGEKPEDAARRELEEETGYHADALEHIGTMMMSPTNENNRLYIFIARDLYKTDKKVHHDAREIIVNKCVAPSDVTVMVRRGEITSQSTLGALYIASQYFSDLHL